MKNIDKFVGILVRFTMIVLFELHGRYVIGLNLGCLSWSDKNLIYAIN